MELSQSTIDSFGQRIQVVSPVRIFLNAWLGPLEWHLWHAQKKCILVVLEQDRTSGFVGKT